jgi:hypothetical protein
MIRYYVLTLNTKSVHSSHTQAFSRCDELLKEDFPIKGVFKVMGHGEGAAPLNVWGSNKNYDAARELTRAHKLKHYVI